MNLGCIPYFKIKMEKFNRFILNLLKNSLTLLDKFKYDTNLNGYSLILSWWRDRPYETQQPAS